MNNAKLYISEEYGVSVTLSAEFQATIVKLARNAGANETGSVLIGTYTDDYSVVIKRGSYIPDGSMGGKMWYKRGKDGLNKYYKDVFRDSGGSEYYIGEWHSHPNGSVSPSDIDDATMTSISRDMSNRGIVSVIVGGNIGKSPIFGVSVYIGDRRIDLCYHRKTSIG